MLQRAEKVTDEKIGSKRDKYHNNKRYKIVYTSIDER